MSMQETLAAKALVARKTRETEDKAIRDDRYTARKVQANVFVTSLFGQMDRAASGGATSTKCVITDAMRTPTGVGGATRLDDPVVDYFLARCKEEGLTVTEVKSEKPSNWEAEVSWGSGE